MKYYLQSANVASNNFMQPVPSYVFDKEVSVFVILPVSLVHEDDVLAWILYTNQIANSNSITLICLSHTEGTFY